MCENDGFSLSGSHIRLVWLLPTQDNNILPQQYYIPIYSQRCGIKPYLLCYSLSAETTISSLINIMSSCGSGMVDGPIETLLKVSEF